MNLNFILAILLYVSAICYVLLGVRVIFAKRDTGSVSVGITFGIIGLWVLGGALELSASSQLLFSIGRVGHFVGTALVPVSLLVCFREYTGTETSKRLIAAMLILPVSSIVVAATNNWHELMWHLPAINDAGEFLARPRQWGLWFLFLHAPFGYSIFTVSLLTLVMHSTAVAPAHRRGLFLLAASAIAPVIAIGAYDFGIGPDTISIVPLVFAAMLPIYAWLIIGEQIIEFSPLAYETVFQNMQDPVVVVDDKKRIIGLNHGAESLLAINESDALRASLESVFGGDAPEVFEALETGKPQKMLTTTGRYLHLQVTPISTNKAATRSGRVLMFRDVSDVEKAQKEVRSSEKLLRTLIDHSINGIIRFRWVGIADQRSLRCTFANAAASKFLNIDVDSMIDRPVDELVRLATSGMDSQESDRVVREFEETIENSMVVDMEAMAENNGQQRWLRIMGEPVGDDVAVTFVEITDRKAKEQQMESIALTDPLTGVLNRRGFERDASSRLLESSDDAMGALLFVDLNEFKQVNDEYGHQVGDQVLMNAAERIRKSLRADDIIGRPGGDEFVVLVPDVDSRIAETLAKRLTRSLEEPYQIGINALQCAASIGLALYPDNANTLTGLMRAADQAMYRAKARCRGVSNIRQVNLLEKAV
jgi:diguanylate cyclase (GGDEF)-like protein